MRINNAADAKHLRRLGLFEFYRAGGLRSEVVQDAVHTRHLMRDAVHEVAHEVERDVLDGGAHGVGGVHGADDDRPLESALAVLHAGGLEVGHDGKILPDLAYNTFPASVNVIFFVPRKKSCTLSSSSSIFI